jgi:general stress protein 26
MRKTHGHQKLFTSFTYTPMDSINQQQAEDNHEDLHGAAAAKRIKTMAEKANICFFCTKLTSGAPFATRPMSVQKVDDDGVLWFLSANDSHKNKEISEDAAVHLLFQGSSYSDFLSIYGRATITEDKAIIKELWGPMLKAWFTEGIDDPRISAIKVAPLEGYYWDNKHGNAVAFIKTLAGAAMGKTLDDSIEGNLKV